MSFTDLIELWFVRQFQKHRVPLEKVRSTYRLMSEKWDTPHPFLKKNLWLVVGKRILAVDIANDPDATVVSDPESCQLYLDKIALEVGNKIAFDDQDFACQWFPLGKAKPIVVDPAFGYGVPTIKGHRLRSKDVYQLWKAENEDVELVCEAYDITPEEVEAAVTWEISRN